jgi:hypothetical protein
MWKPQPLQASRRLQVPVPVSVAVPATALARSAINNHRTASPASSAVKEKRALIVDMGVMCAYGGLGVGSHGGVCSVGALPTRDVMRASCETRCSRDSSVASRRFGLARTEYRNTMVSDPPSMQSRAARAVMHVRHCVAACADRLVAGHPLGHLTSRCALERRTNLNLGRRKTLGKQVMVDWS